MLIHICPKCSMPNIGNVDNPICQDCNIPMVEAVVISREKQERMVKALKDASSFARQLMTWKSYGEKGNLAYRHMLHIAELAEEGLGE